MINRQIPALRWSFTDVMQMCFFRRISRSQNVSGVWCQIRVAMVPDLTGFVSRENWLIFQSLQRMIVLPPLRHKSGPWLVEIRKIIKLQAYWCYLYSLPNDDVKCSTSKFERQRDPQQQIFRFLPLYENHFFPDTSLISKRDQRGIMLLTSYEVPL